MLRARRPLSFLTTLGVILSLTSALPAGAREKEKNEIVPSGFLGDYSDLEPHPDKKGLLVYRKRDNVLAGYDKFIIDPPLVYFHPEAAGQGVDPEDLKMLTQDLHQKLVEALTEGHAYEVVEEPGEGVAHIRIALTDVVPVDPKKNVGAKAAGMVVGVGLLVPRVDLGRASIEAEALDSQTGERLVAVVAVKEPRRFGGLIKGSKEWGDARAAFKAWAKQFRERLDQAHGH